VDSEEVHGSYLFAHRQLCVHIEEGSWITARQHDLLTMISLK